MTIPATPLVVKQFDANSMTLDDLELFEPGGFSASGFKRFLVEHTNWTAKEIGSIKISELNEISNQLGAAIKELTVPKESATPSKTTPAAN